MNPLQEMVLIGEIVLQSKIARRAAERLEAHHSNVDNLEIWSSIQSILVATANVSKILWPNIKYKARGERLRQMLRVENSNILFSRKFRNYFEHYDEQIDDWFKNQPSAVYIDLAMNPSLQGRFTSRGHRGYNSFNNTLIFRDESLDLGEVLRALEGILNNCKHMLSCRTYVGCNFTNRQDAKKYSYSEPDTDFTTELFDLVDPSNVDYRVFKHSHEVMPDSKIGKTEVRRLQCTDLSSQFPIRLCTYLL